MKETNFKKRVSKVMEYGIENEGIRNSSQLELIFHFWSLRLTREQTIEQIELLFRTLPNNSRTWRTNRQGALNNLHSAVYSFYRKRERKGKIPFKVHKRQLTLADVLKIIGFTRDYRLGKFIYHLLLHCRNNMDSKNELRIPRTLIVKFPCCSMQTYQEKMNFCKKVGLIEVTRKHSCMGHRARTYKVNFQFDDRGELVTSFDEALTKLLPQGELKKYSRWTYEKYLRPMLQLPSH